MMEWRCRCGAENSSPFKPCPECGTVWATWAQKLVIDAYNELSKEPVGEDEEDDYRNRDTITCAEYYHARARALCARGDIADAKERVKMAGEPWPPIRQEMLDDPELEGIW